MKQRRKINNRPSTKIIPLGGLDQIGMNITAFEYGDQIIVVDCGQSFPTEDMPGIDMVIPDVTYLVENAHKVKGFFITHGHEDHIGAIPYVLKQINAPIYATKLTMAIIEGKLDEHGLMTKVKRKVIADGSSVVLGDFRVEFIRSTHSIQDSVMLAINTPAGVILHTGDFKVDFTPVYGKSMNLCRLAELGKKGITAVLCDSTNVLRPGYTMSERTVGKRFDNIFAENRKRRILVATFASNVDRVQQIMDMAKKYNRHIFVEGRSMVRIIKVASELGYLNLHDLKIESTDNIKNYPDEKIVLITTGSQGESMAALPRIAASIHKKVTLKPGDVVVFSSSPIPGNEKSVSKVMNELAQKGATVIYEDTHVSGHACQEEIKLIYTLTKPKYVVPVHGEFRHLAEHSKLAKSLGYSSKNIFVLETGDVLSINQEEAKVVDKVPAGAVYVDGLGVGDVGNIVIKDRQHMSEAGIVIVSLSLRRGSSQVVCGPDIITRGFVFAKESEDLLLEVKKVATDVVFKTIGKKRRVDWNDIKSDLREEISRFIWKKTKRRPLVISTIMEVD